MGSVYSNEPSEIAGVICSNCSIKLPAVSGWCDIKIKAIEGRLTHEFLKGKYYREKIPSAKHLCWECFWSPENTKKQRKEEAEMSAKLGIEKLKDEMENLKAELAKARDELMSSRSELSGVKTEFSEVQGKLTDARNELRITEDKVTKAKKELESPKQELAKVKSELAEAKRQVQSGELQKTSTKVERTVVEAWAPSSKITKSQTSVKEYVATALEASDVKDKDANIEASKDHATTTCPSARFPVQVTDKSKDSESRDSTGNTIKPANVVDSNELGKTKDKPGNAKTKLQTATMKTEREVDARASEYVATALEAGDAKDEAVKFEASEDDVTTTCKSARFPSQATENCKDSETRDPNSNTINTMTVQHLVGHR